MTADTARAVAALRTLGLILTDDWPMIAAHLLADGGDGDALVALASLSRTATVWEIDEAVDRFLAEFEMPVPEVEDAGEVAARVLATALRDVTDAREFAIVVALARISPDRDYPGGVIGEAYYAAEWIDCECHRDSAQRDDAADLERRLRALPPLEVEPAMLSVLTRWM